MSRSFQKFWQNINLDFLTRLVQMLTSIIFFHIQLYYIYLERQYYLQSKILFLQINYFVFCKQLLILLKVISYYHISKLEHHGICGVKLLKFSQNKNLDFLTRLVHMLTSIIFFHVQLYYIWKDSIICKARFYFCKSNIF